MIHKGIAQRDKCGNLINEFPNITTAAKVTGIPYATILANAGGRAATGYGFVWEYTTEEKYQPPRREAKRLRRPVAKYDRDGREVARFPSVCTAAAGSPESINTIRNHLKSGKPTRGGFTWWYLERAQIVNTFNMENVDLTKLESGENWAKIPNCKYQVSDRGRVRDAGGNIQIQELGKTGYLRVYISGAWRFVHKLVAVAFVPNVIHSNHVIHRDGDKTNNNANNLVWVRHNAAKPDEEKEKIFKQYF